MMYNEFCELTQHFYVDVISESDYHKHIEPAYLSAPAELDKKTFCHEFMAIHAETVGIIANGLIIATPEAEIQQKRPEIHEKIDTITQIFLQAFTGIYEKYTDRKTGKFTGGMIER